MSTPRCSVFLCMFGSKWQNRDRYTREEKGENKSLRICRLTEPLLLGVVSSSFCLTLRKMVVTCGSLSTTTWMVGEITLTKNFRWRGPLSWFPLFLADLPCPQNSTPISGACPHHLYKYLQGDLTSFYEWILKFLRVYVFTNPLHSGTFLARVYVYKTVCVNWKVLLCVYTM